MASVESHIGNTIQRQAFQAAVNRQDANAYRNQFGKPGTPSQRYAMVMVTDIQPENHRMGCVEVGGDGKLGFTDPAFPDQLQQFFISGEEPLCCAGCRYRIGGESRIGCSIQTTPEGLESLNYLEVLKENAFTPTQAATILGVKREQIIREVQQSSAWVMVGDYLVKRKLEPIEGIENPLDHPDFWNDNLRFQSDDGKLTLVVNLRGEEKKHNVTLYANDTAEFQIQGTNKIGFAAFYNQPDGLIFSGMKVRPEYRGKGLSLRMLEVMENEMSKLFEKSLIGTAPQTKPALCALLMRNGFIPKLPIGSPNTVMTWKEGEISYVYFEHGGVENSLRNKLTNMGYTITRNLPGEEVNADEVVLLSTYSKS